MLPRKHAIFQFDSTWNMVVVGTIPVASVASVVTLYLAVGHHENRAV